MSEWPDGLERDADGTIKPIIGLPEWLPDDPRKTAARAAYEETDDGRRDAVIIVVCPTPRCNARVGAVFATTPGLLYAANPVAEREVRELGKRWSDARFHVPPAFEPVRVLVADATGEDCYSRCPKCAGGRVYVDIDSLRAAIQKRSKRIAAQRCAQ